MKSSKKIRQDQKSFIWMAPKVLDYPPTNFSDASPAVACGRTHMQVSGKLVPQWDPRGTLEKAKKWNLGPYWDPKTVIRDLSGTLVGPQLHPLFIYLFIYSFIYLFNYLFIHLVHNS